ncbi:hypothetical protein XELAEV_18042677mg [Xenopus laevis]|uniref:Uncharacterized protein n=1 Tax=Xenopus laevis TaxID=8355 RepID=A0A974C4D7_XENLA|nr:hypothetical protein XELAEV_18042677mg [Xenopus laevis]
MVAGAGLLFSVYGRETPAGEKAAPLGNTTEPPLGNHLGLIKIWAQYCSNVVTILFISDIQFGLLLLPGIVNVIIRNDML